MTLDDDFFTACLDGVTAEQLTRAALYRIAETLTYDAEPAVVVRVASWLETGKEQ